jgi:hypothetical protein
MLSKPTPQPKPERPVTLERHERKLSRKRAEDTEKQAAKRRDGGKCRWPHCEYRAVSQVIDAAHVIQAEGMGGDPKLRRSKRHQLLAVCRLHHRGAAVSLHSGDLKVQPMTSAGTDGPCSFWRWTDQGWCVVAEEVSIGIYRRD